METLLPYSTAMRRALLHRGRRSSPILLLAGVAAAATAAVAAPPSPLLPAPVGPTAVGVATAVLAVGFALGLHWPLHALYGVVALTIAEGAVRRWAVNDLTVFLLKDFLLVGVYAAVLPRLRRAQLRRPWWLLAPLAGLIALALLHVPRSESLAQAVIGIRSYALYVPLLWVAPALLTTTRRLRVLVVGLLVVGAAEGVLAVIQAYEGVGVLNKLVSGAIPGFVTFGGVTYLRSTGTFMQAGVLAAFVFATTLVAAASVAFGDRTLRRGALGALVILTWAVVYTSSRALLATFVVAIAALVGWLLGTRRPALAAAGPAAIALGAALLFLVLPAIRDAIGGADAGRHRILAIEDGRVVEIETTIGSGSSAGGGFLRRAAGFGDEGGGEVSGIWRERVRPQLEIVTAQRLIGHGPGTMTLGTGYAHPEARLEGESQFAKAAWELGLPGLALFVWLLGAAALVALDALRRTTGDRRVVAGAAALLTLLLPAWLTLTFAYDYPIVGELYWLLLGCCSTWTGPAIAHEEDA